MYIFWFLHQTTTCRFFTLQPLKLYIFWFLHQTTTWLLRHAPDARVVYLLIPTSNHNLLLMSCYLFIVVYLLIPTSNHNPANIFLRWRRLYIFWFLHQTTTHSGARTWRHALYIFWFLHQTTTNTNRASEVTSCISFDSYIKPQLCGPRCNGLSSCISFDSYIKPQLKRFDARYAAVVYLLIPTSNHNTFAPVKKRDRVVYLLIPTSNHNLQTAYLSIYKLYIFWFLHQTTTIVVFCMLLIRCISFDSYIKPQHLCNS